MNLKLKTLFICFYFPPFSRVGGRRWAKYLKYLMLNGEDFHVLAGDYNAKSNWDKDVESYKHKITRIPIKIKYPYHKKKLPNSFFEKIVWKLSSLLWNLKAAIYIGNFWDDSVGYESVFFKNAVQIIEKNNIEQILITLGPFRISSILVKLKKRYPNLKIIVDYRDRLEESFANMPDSIVKQEQLLQDEVLKSIDFVLSPYEYMRKFYKEKYNLRSELLPHCYDEFDFIGLNFDNRTNYIQNEIKFVYGGSLYNGLEENFEEYFKFLKSLKKLGYTGITNLYAPQKGYEKLIVESNTHINLLPVLSLKNYYNEILNSDYALIFRPKWSNDNFSSKFFELIRLGKPILYIGDESEVSKFIETNRLGFVLHKLDNDDSIIKMIEKVQNKQVPNKYYQIEKHSFKNSTLDLIEILNG